MIQHNVQKGTPNQQYTQRLGNLQPQQGISQDNVLFPNVADVRCTPAKIYSTA